MGITKRVFELWGHWPKGRTIAPKIYQIGAEHFFQKNDILSQVYLLINFVLTDVPSNFNPRLGLGFGNYIFVFFSLTRFLWPYFYPDKSVTLLKLNQ